MIDFRKYILDAYKDLNEPDYRFVKSALDSNRHSQIETEFVKSGFIVQDDTEPNTDVCRTLILSRDDANACIKLSFVGPFAAVFILNDISSITAISQVLSAQGLQIVARDILVRPYDMDLLGLDAGSTLYNVLFSSDAMPV